MQNREELIITLPEAGIDFISFGLNAPKGSLAACLPDTYIENDQLRISAYRQLGDIQDLEQLKEFSEQLEDIFGKRPAAVDVLLEVTKLRLILSRADCKKIIVANNQVSIFRNDGTVFRKNGIIPRLDPRDTPQMRLRQLQYLAEMVAKQDNLKKVTP